jgi:plastocyanin
MRGLRIIPAAFAGAGLITLALSVGIVLASTTVHVKESNDKYSFNPGSITVALGDTVTWTNDSDATHSATADDGSFDAGSFAKGKSVSHTFNTAGTFAYHCNFHSYMHGTITVLAAGVTPPATDTVPVGNTDSGGGSPWLLLLALAGVGMVAFSAILLRRGRDA